VLYNKKASRVDGWPLVTLTSRYGQTSSPGAVAQQHIAMVLQDMEWNAAEDTAEMLTIMQPYRAGGVLTSGPR